MNTPTLQATRDHPNIVVRKWTLVRKASSDVLTIAFQRVRLSLTVLLALLLSLSAMPSYAQSISFDATVLISQVNIWIVIFLPILSIGMGINIAIALVEKVGDSILGAFRR